MNIDTSNVMEYKNNRDDIYIVLECLNTVKSHCVQSWVSDCCLTPTQQFFYLYHVENKLIFNEMMMKSSLY